MFLVSKMLILTIDALAGDGNDAMPKSAQVLKTRKASLNSMKLSLND
jgi:hypothetical protein